MAHWLMVKKLEELNIKNISVPQARRAVARAIDGGAGCGGGVPLHPHRQRIRHGGAAAAGGTGLGRQQSMAQAADGGGADAGGVLPAFPRTPPCPR